MLAAAVLLTLAALTADAAVGGRLTAAVDDATLARDPHDLRVACASRQGGDIVTFVRGADGRVLLASLTHTPLTDPSRDIWLSPGVVTSKSPVRPSGTQDWAYVHSSRRDGAIDQIAYLIGPLPLAPDPPPADLPILAEGGKLSRSDLTFALSHMGFGFWQAIDIDGDGRPDVLAFPARRRSNGWHGGWAVVSLARSGEATDCRLLGPHGEAAGDCVIAPDAREIAAATATAHMWAPPSRAAEVFAEIRHAAVDCRLGGDDLRP